MEGSGIEKVIPVPYVLFACIMQKFSYACDFPEACCSKRNLVYYNWSLLVFSYFKSKGDTLALQELVVMLMKLTDR